MITLSGLLLVAAAVRIGSQREDLRENGTVAAMVVCGMMFIVVGITTNR